MEIRPRVWDERSDVGQPDHQDLPQGAPGGESDPDPEHLVHHDRNTHRYVPLPWHRAADPDPPGRRSSPKKFTPHTRARYIHIRLCRIMCYGDITCIDMGLETAGVWRACVSFAATRRAGRPSPATAAPAPQAGSGPGLPLPPPRAIAYAAPQVSWSGSAGCSSGGDAARPRGRRCPRRDGRG